MRKEDQQILVVRTAKLFPSGIWEGFRTGSEVDGLLDLINQNGEYRRRGDMENDSSFQQIIPQIVLIAENKLFIHQIPDSGSESRLHGLFPIFLGGHVENTDIVENENDRIGNTVEVAAEREFREELVYKGRISVRKFVGAINLQDNDVNSVHFGLVWVYEGDKAESSDNFDEGVSQGRFVGWDEAADMIDQMSYWSKLAFPELRKRFEILKEA